MPRGGDGFIIRAQKIDNGGGATTLDVVISVETKNSEETTNPTSGLVTLTIEGTDTTAVIEKLFEPSAAGVEELVRLKVTTVNGSEGLWMLCRTFPLIWFEGAQ